MSYTRLTFNDADISFFGESTYTRLTFNDSDITFFEEPDIELPILDGSINSYTINTTSINDYFFGATTGNSLSGNITQFEQRVGVKLFLNKTITQFEQDIEHIRRLSNTITQFEQTVVNRLTGNITVFEQVIREPETDNIDKYGWDALITVNGLEIPANILKGDIKTDHQESSSSLMEFTLQPSFGIQNLEQYVGKRVTLDYLTNSGVKRLYTGIVDSPDIDIKGKRIRFNCTNDRETLINTKMRTLVKTIGFYSNQVTPTDNPHQELEQRIKTVPTAVDFDFNENPQITSWFAKSTADFTFNNANVYFDKENNPPQVTWYNAARVVNKINLSFTYQYQRLYHWERQFLWIAPYRDSICDFINNGYSLCPRDAIRQAVDGTGWKTRNAISFDPLYTTGWYTCGGVDFVWSTVNLQGSSVAQTDSEGNNVLDEDGNQVFDGVITGITDYTNVYCLGFSANLSTRWLQNIDEQYSLTITAPQSIEQLGTIEEDKTGSIEAINDELVENWENYTQYTSPPISGISASSYYIDRRNNINDFNQSLTAEINTARTRILEAHRQTTVNLLVRMNPDIQLRHTVETDIDPIHCKGKVRRIQHTLDMINRNRCHMSIDIAIFRAGTTSVSDSSFSVPTQPTDSLTLTGSAIALNSWYGVDPTIIPASSFNGHIANKYLTERVGVTINKYRTNYQEAFVIDTPAIPNEWRLQRDLSKTQSYNVAIPNDTLEIEF